jgi:hypothetical protein
MVIKSGYQGVGLVQDIISMTIMQDGFTFNSQNGWDTFQFGVHTVIPAPEPDPLPNFRPAPMPVQTSQDDVTNDDGFVYEPDPIDSIPDHVKEAIENESRSREAQGLDGTITVKPVYPDAYYEQQAQAASGQAMNLVEYYPSYEAFDSDGNKIEMDGLNPFENLFSQDLDGESHEYNNPLDDPHGKGTEMDGGMNLQGLELDEQGVEFGPAEMPVIDGSGSSTMEIDVDGDGATESVEVSPAEMPSYTSSEGSTTITVPREQIDQIPGDTLDDKEQFIEDTMNDNALSDEFNDVAPEGYDVDIVCTAPEQNAAPEQDVEILHFNEEEAVTDIQTYLIGRGHDDVGDAENNPDGMFGNGSSRALEDELKGVQERHGLDVTGEFNDATLDALKEDMDALDEGPQKDSMESFIGGLDYMDNKDVEGHSALDRVYNPDTNDPKEPEQSGGTCEVTVNTTLGAPSQLTHSA